jgi:hypothetical protein
MRILCPLLLSRESPYPNRRIYVCAEMASAGMPVEHRRKHPQRQCRRQKERRSVAAPPVVSRRLGKLRQRDLVRNRIGYRNRVLHRQPGNLLAGPPPLHPAAQGQYRTSSGQSRLGNTGPAGSFPDHGIRRQGSRPQLDLAATGPHFLLVYPGNNSNFNMPIRRSSGVPEARISIGHCSRRVHP